MFRVYLLFFHQLDINVTHLRSVTFLSMLALFQVHPLLPSNGEGSSLTPAVIKLHLRQQAQSHHTIISNVILIHRTGRVWFCFCYFLLINSDHFHINDMLVVIMLILFRQQQFGYNFECLSFISVPVLSP